MTEDRRRTAESKRQRTALPSESRPPSSVLRPLLSILLPGLCLCVLALRVTYTESPTGQVLTMPGSLTDTVYSLTLSGLLIFAFVLWLLWGVFRGRLTYRFTGIEVGLAIFLAAAAISTSVASDKRAALTQAMTLLGPICAALLLVQTLDHPAKIRLALIVLVALGIVSAYQCAEQSFLSNAITIEQYEKDPKAFLEPLGIETGTFPHFLFEHRLYSRGVRGFFTTSNSAASFAILACGAAAGLLLERFRNRKVPGAPPFGLFAALAAVLTVAGLALTQSKGGILAFCAGAAACGTILGINRWLPTYRRRILMVAGPLILLLAAGAAYATIQYGLKHDRLPGGNSMLVRWQYWAASARMIADHRRTGVGLGNFADYYTHYKPAAALESVADPHNFVLSLLAQCGPLGLIGFLTMVLLPVGRILVRRQTTPSESEACPSLPFQTLALATLLGVSICLLLVRLLLIPLAGDSLDVLLYELVTIHIAPVAAFLIGFLLIASPLGDARPQQIDFANSTFSVVLGCTLMAVLLHNLVDFAIFEPGVWMAFWVTVACLLAPRVHRRTGVNLAFRPSRMRKPLALGVAGVLLGACLVEVWRPACVTAAAIQGAQQLAATGRSDDAHGCLEAAVRSDPLSPAAANINGQLYLQQSEQTPAPSTALLESAALCFEQAIRRNPADYKNYEKLATTYSRLGQPRKAYEWYLKAAGLYPGRERIWFELARTAEQLGKTGLALCHYVKTVEIEDSFRQQFQQMYPDREKVVSRLGDQDYEHAQKRIKELSK